MANKAQTFVFKFTGQTKGLEGAVSSVTGSLEKVAGKSRLAVAGMASVAAIGVTVVSGLAKLGASFDESFDKIRIGTGATGEQLKGLEESFRNVYKQVPDGMGAVATAIANVNTRLGLTGEPLESLATQYLNLSRLTGTDLDSNITNISRVFGDWSIATDNQAKSMDEIFRASQVSGIGIDQLTSSIVSYGAPLRNLNFTYEESLALLSQFERSGVNTELVMGGLKAGIGKLAKAGEDVPATFRRVLESIQTLGPGTEATGLAIELFGQRAGPDLADAIAGGKFEFGQFLDAIVNGQDTINGVAEDTDDAGEAFARLKHKIAVELEPAATWAFNKLGEGVDWLSLKFDEFLASDRWDSFKQWWNDNWPTIIRYVQRLGDKVAEVSTPIARRIGTEIVGALDSFSQWWVDKWPDIESSMGDMKAAGNEGFGGMSDILSDHLNPAMVELNGAFDDIKVSLGQLYEGLVNLKEALGFVNDSADGDNGANSSMREFGKIIGWGLILQVGALTAVVESLATGIGLINSTIVTPAVRAIEAIGYAAKFSFGWLDKMLNALDRVPGSKYLFGAVGAAAGTAAGSGGNTWASGGYVTKPTFGLVGEGGQNEFIFNASQMRGLAAEGISLGGQQTQTPTVVNNYYNVAGSILSERDFADLVVSVQRQGLVGAL